jgi:glutamate synthase (NADPH/NADH) large chain/glutamate synthase (ferredoxin)
VLPLEFSGLSDSAILDQALELLVRSGRSVPHALMMLVPEADEEQRGVDPSLRAFLSTTAV